MNRDVGSEHATHYVIQMSRRQSKQSLLTPDQLLHNIMF